MIYPVIETTYKAVNAMTPSFGPDGIDDCAHLMTIAGVYRL